MLLWLLVLQRQAPTLYSMQFLQSSIEGSSSLPLDPWDWSVDQVVFALTNPQSSLLTSNPTLSLPNASEFADILRKDGTSGLALLCEIKDNDLRDDLGIKSRGHRASINHLIRKLQYRSAKYQDEIIATGRAASSIGTGSLMGSRMGTPFMGVPFIGSPQRFDSSYNPRISGFWQSPVAPSGRFQSLPPIDPNAGSAWEQRASLMHDILAEAPILPRPDWQNVQNPGKVEGLGIKNMEKMARESDPRGVNGYHDPPGVVSERALDLNLDESTIQPEQRVRQGETTVVDERGKKRRRLVPSSVDIPLTIVPDVGQSVSAERPLSSPSTLDKVSDDAFQFAAEHLPDLESPIVQDGASFIDARSNNTTIGRELSDVDSKGQAPEPSSLHVGKDGRKRMRPVLLTQPEPNMEESHPGQMQSDQDGHKTSSSLHPILKVEAPSSFQQRTYGRKADRTKDQIYLGPQPLSIDELFYGDRSLETNLDSEESPNTINEPGDFTITSGEKSSEGLCLYVSGRMKYFFQRRSIELNGKGLDYRGIVPYPSRIGRKNYPLSMTIFSRSAEGLSAIRSNRSKWLVDDSEHDQRISGDGPGSSFNVADPSLAQDDGDDPEWKALEKWKYMDGQDDVLPLYGESGSDGEYELDTWKEMEQERGELARFVGKSKGRKLTLDQVNEAIDVATKQIAEEWTIKRKPKLQQKAWRLWVKSRREGTVNAQIDRLTHETDRINGRLTKLRKEIAQEEWSKSSQISKQCKILQPSIFETEDNDWKMATLRLQKMPKKPLPTECKAKNVKVHAPDQVLNEDEEILETDADDSTTSEGSLADFIVDGDPDASGYEPIAADDDLTLADVEDAIDSDTLVGGKDPAMRQTIPKLETIPKPEPSTQDDKEQILESLPVTSKKPQIVDLTLDSDPIEPEIPVEESVPSFEIKTPPINDSEDESDIFQRSRTQRPVFKILPIPKQTSVIDLDTESQWSTAVETFPAVKKVLPSLKDVDAIRSMDPTELVERQDRKRLLIWMIAHASQYRRNAAAKYLTQVSLEDSHREVRVGLQRIREYKQTMRGLNKETSDGILSIASWQVCWAIPVKAEPSGLNTAHIDITLEDENGYEPFYDHLLECLSHYHEPTPLDHSTSKKKRQKIIREDSEECEQITSIRKRKYVVHESQQTLDKRQAAQDRMREDQLRRRREELKSGNGSIEPKGGSSKVIVNPGKLEDQDFIHLNSNFGNGARIKPHQEEGLQFLWREITAEPNDPQGCLLAQTMGLGKTMQVIALLVTISESGQSADKKIRHQVPRPLRNPRTLVLCPPALLENWWDEFIIWIPRTSPKALGEIRKVSASLDVIDRLSEIQAWSDKGGILLIGYDTFKNLIHNTPRTSKKSKITKVQLNNDQHERVKTALLDGANLVVADEAHSFKRQSSKLHLAMGQIKTRSRIALTGSPLNNNLQEYYTIIDWIAPNYLGTYAEFKATYEEPIREGLYQESTVTQYRESRKRLKALELEMEPKIHRANVSVLHNDLQGKMEFVVKVPLTKPQEDLYRIYVKIIRSAISGKEPGQSSLWSWLGVLQLLCNHPKCYRELLVTVKAKLSNGGRSKASAIKKRPNPSTINEGLLGSEEDAALLDEPSASIAFSRIVNESENYFQGLAEPLDALSLSNKMQILMQILKFATTAQDKVLVFSHRIATLDYIEAQLRRGHQEYARIDGAIATQKRQQVTKRFNEGQVNICLISTRAGGTGLNLYGANRVVILDDHFNPAWELQAIGRAYRIGQKKPVFVYRLTAGGTFEQEIQNQALFKEQLANRVVDKKNPNRTALKKAGDYLFPPRTLPEEDLSESHGKDPIVLDRLLADRAQNRILSITPSETFHIEDGVELTPAEREEAEQMQKDEQLRRRDPQAYYKKEADRRAKQLHPGMQHTKIPPPKKWIPYNGAPSTQPLQRLPSSTVHPDWVLPPSTAPTMNVPMGGLPYPDYSTQNTGGFLTASHGVNLTPISLCAEHVRHPTLRELQSPLHTDEYGQSSTEIPSRSETMLVSSGKNGTDTGSSLINNGTDDPKNSPRKVEITSSDEMPSYLVEPDISEVSDALEISDITLGAMTTPEKRAQEGGGSKQPSHEEGRGSRGVVSLKHNLSEEASGQNKRLKPNPKITPNFKGDGPMEQGLMKILVSGAAGSSKL